MRAHHSRGGEPRARPCRPRALGDHRRHAAGARRSCAASARRRTRSAALGDGADSGGVRAPGAHALRDRGGADRRSAEAGTHRGGGRAALRLYVGAGAGSPVVVRRAVPGRAPDAGAAAARAGAPARHGAHPDAARLRGVLRSAGLPDRRRLRRRAPRSSAASRCARRRAMSGVRDGRVRSLRVWRPSPSRTTSAAPT